VRPVKANAVIALAALIATLGLDRTGGTAAVAVADHPLDGHFDPLMPRYPRAAEFPIGGGLETGEGLVRMSYFSTADAPLLVARYYRAVWEQEGLAVHDNVTPEGGVVGTFDPRVGAARSVTILAARGRTWGFPAVVRRPVDAVRSGDLGRDDGLPVFPGSSAGLTFRSSEGGERTVVASSSNTGGLEENIAFYRRELAADGWQELPEQTFSELGGHRSLELERGAERLTVSLTPVGEGDAVVVCVILGARR
jgi:hypothetical protein